MMNSNHEDIRKHLLGDLGMEERENLESRIIEDDGFGMEALAAEDILIESYVDGELSDAEAEKFRSNYLTTEARVQRVKEFVALRAAARALGDPDRSEQRADEHTTSRWNFTRFFASLTPAMSVGLLILIAGTGVGVWLYFSDGRMSALESEYAALNRDDFSDPTTLALYSNVPVLPNTFRGAESGTKVTTATLTQGVLFRLPLTFEPTPDAKFQAAVIREGKTIFRVEDRRPVKVGSAYEIRVLLPRSVIVKGQNQISLLQSGADVAPVLFQFTAE